MGSIHAVRGSKTRTGIDVGFKVLTLDQGIHIISSSIKNEALRLGFTDCGFSRAEPLPADAEKLEKWLEKGYQSGMDYMKNHFEKRTDPTRLVKGARSVISLLYSYFTRQAQEDPEAPVLSKYAFGKDYHRIMKKKMQSLFDFIDTRFGPVNGRIFVDSAPVLERAWARKAGLGWIGKNSNLISRKAGSFVFIGEIIIDLEVDYHSLPESDFCGSCTRCIDTCPTDAILPGRTLDAARCISYQTIENKQPIDEHLRSGLSNRMFGCDICQDVCPWNRKVQTHKEPGFEPSPELLSMCREEWNTLDKERYSRLFQGSAVNRAGYPKLMDTIRILNDSDAINP